MKDDSACYWIYLCDPKGEMIVKKLMRIYHGREKEAEMIGMQIGLELGRDALSDMTEEAAA